MAVSNSPVRSGAGGGAPPNRPETWDRAQQDVIELPANARVLVSAGPGTGKTAVACRRAAELIDRFSVAPTNIWIISFTRTAVKEIRDRLQSYLARPDDAFSIKVATIDSHAWAIHSGFDDNASLTGSYEDNIAHVIDLVQTNAGVFEYLGDLQHLIVDEAQDVVDVRCELLIAIIRRLTPECGVSVFADEAQAIYGFTTDEGEQGSVTEHLFERLLRTPELGFTQHRLTVIHRTSTPGLRRLFTEGRGHVTSEQLAGHERFSTVRQLIAELADEEGKLEKLDPQDGDFVLFRRRLEVLRASSFWGIRPHRLRMSGLPVSLHPWLGVIFSDYTEKRISKAQFTALCSERLVQGWEDVDVSRAWEQLVRIAGETASVVSMKTLRSKLSRRSPPIEFCRPDFGVSGPIFGTIHGCKGRESDTVHLALPQETGGDGEEEARVLFVGATRARRFLKILPPHRPWRSGPRISSGRAYIVASEGRSVQAQVEIGHDGDIEAEGLIGRAAIPGAKATAQVQRWLRENAYKYSNARCVTDESFSYRYRMWPADGGPCVATLSQSLNNDLFDIGQHSVRAAGLQGRVKPPNQFLHLRVLGSRTIVLPTEVERGLLHEPWEASGFLLAPMVIGFDMAYFRWYSRRDAW